MKVAGYLHVSNHFFRPNFEISSLCCFWLKYNKIQELIKRCQISMKCLDVFAKNRWLCSHFSIKMLRNMPFLSKKFIKYGTCRYEKFRIFGLKSWFRIYGAKRRIKYWYQLIKKAIKKIFWNFYLAISRQIKVITIFPNPFLIYDSIRRTLNIRVSVSELGLPYPKLLGGLWSRRSVTTQVRGLFCEKWA